MGNNSQKRYKSLPLWASVLALIYLVARYWFNFEIPGWADISSQIIAVLTILFGEANNPTNCSGF